MSAADHLQLQMFMPARQLRNDVEPGDFSKEGGEEWGWQQKLNESKIEGTEETTWNDGIPQRGNSLHESIRSSGVQKPVELMHTRDWSRQQNPKALLANGHHRVAVANDIDPNMEIPVEHRGRVEFERPQRPDRPAGTKRLRTTWRAEGQLPARDPGMVAALQSLARVLS